ncbi:MAG TPA: 4-phosphoerythronate dehydrogenase [Gammaproteobacteria bacterium]|nr:4-phosphoerythronate dehydrogenase [Gammaproteobacteria bacterium]
MKIVADESIPLINHYFGEYGDLILKNGREISRQDLLTADALIVRAVTQVDKNLLHDTPVKFVGSVTAGQDHLDTIWLEETHIPWRIAAGCNAIAVADYLICTIAFLQKNEFLKKKKLRIGVIGVGHAGSEVVEKLSALDCDIIQCDPLRAVQDKTFHSTPIEELSDLDVITLHVPLTKIGDFPTYHLIEKNFLERQNKNCVLINTSRGDVIHTEDLQRYGNHLIVCFDVFPHEPAIDLTLVKMALITTPHIAGYSIQAKYRGIEMIHQALKKSDIFPKKTISAIVLPKQEISFSYQEMDWQEVVLSIYDPHKTSLEMKEKLNQDKNSFDSMRKNFVERCEFSYMTIKNVKLSEQSQRLLTRLGLSIKC